MDCQLIIDGIRRLIGDMDVDNRKYSDQDIAFFFYDAVEDVQGVISFDNTVTVTNVGTAITEPLLRSALALYRLKTLILIKESSLNEALYDGGMISVGDIKVDTTALIRVRKENLKRVCEEYEKLLYDVKMNNQPAYDIDTYVTGLVNNTFGREYMSYDLL